MPFSAAPECLYTNLTFNISASLYLPASSATDRIQISFLNLTFNHFTSPLCVQISFLVVDKAGSLAVVSIYNVDSGVLNHIQV
jgi:hypothetical protein